MICEWCIENKQTLVAQNLLNSTRFSYKAGSISYRSASSGCHTANLLPENTLANLAEVGGEGKLLGEHQVIKTGNKEPSKSSSWKVLQNCYEPP